LNWLMAIGNTDRTSQLSSHKAIYIFHGLNIGKCMTSGSACQTCLARVEIFA